MKLARLARFWPYSVGLVATLAVTLFACGPEAPKSASTPSATRSSSGSTAPTSVPSVVPTTAPSSGPGPWSDSLAEYGMPATPQRWQPRNFDVQIHTRDMESDNGNDPHAADHGAACEAPPATHMVDTWQEGVYICHNHVMTSIKSDGYGLITLTPDHMANWADGAVTIGFSVSTFQTDPRDWITVDVTPFDEQLALPFN